ncbi:MAG: esterase [Oxalobacter sp.]|nr:MAG: esterase [Oxalobacter sp.]
MKIDFSKFAAGGADLSFLPPALLGRIVFRHRAPSAPPLPPGRHHLEVAAERDTLLVVPEGLYAHTPVPLLVLFHGASGHPSQMLHFFENYAHEHRFLLMTPQSTMVTWDLSLAGHGPDLDRLEKALMKVATHFTLLPEKLGLAGFSDGASYALSVALSNGDWVSHAMVLSGGYMNVYKPTGKPMVFIAHSPEDEQLPIDTSGRKHAKILKDSGYDVAYHEFSGHHAIYPAVVEKAMAFFLPK